MHGGKVACGDTSNPPSHETSPQSKVSGSTRDGVWTRCRGRCMEHVCERDSRRAALTARSRDWFRYSFALSRSIHNKTLVIRWTVRPSSTRAERRISGDTDGTLLK